MWTSTSLLLNIVMHAITIDVGCHLDDSHIVTLKAISG